MQLNIYFEFFQLDMFRAYMPIFKSNRCYSFFTYVAYGVLGLVWLDVGPEECVCWWRVAVLAVQHANSTHTPQDRHLTRLSQGHHMLHI